MKAILSFFLVMLVISCGKLARRQERLEIITEAGKQDTIFKNLLALIHSTVPETQPYDSLVFLLLPMQASCPACRNKTIDSIVKHQNALLNSRYIIISANGGRKIINSYFKERKSQIPKIPGHLFLDSTGEAYKYNLYEDNPTLYFTANRKAYKKITAIPVTVKEDLREFFSGFRLNTDGK